MSRTNKNLTFLFKKSTLIVTSFFFLLILFSLVWTNIVMFKSGSAILRKNYLSETKQLIKTQVEDALDLIAFERETTVGLTDEHRKKTIMEQLEAIRFGENKEGYMFIVTYQGVTVLNDTQKELVGKNLWNLTDPNGVKVIQEERKAAERPGGGFIYYSWLNPSTGKVSPKISYIMGIPDWNWMIGTGLYVDDIEKSVKNLQIKLYRETLQSVGLLFVVTLGVIGIIFLLFQRILRYIKNDISIFTHYYSSKKPDIGRINTEKIYWDEFFLIASALNKTMDKTKQAETKSLSSEERFNNLFSRINDVILITDKNRILVDANQPALKKHFGYDFNEISGKSTLMLFESFDEYEESGKKITAARQNEFSSKPISIKYTKKDGSTFPAEALAFSFRNYKTDELLFATINRDITQRMKSHRILKDSLKEKEILLREVHHRVKNNMSIILAFLSLKSSITEDAKVTMALDSIEKRVRAMSLVHELLYSDVNLKTLSAKKYLGLLAEELLESAPNNIQLNMSVADVQLDLNYLIPMGLIVNEIITNTIKHAFTPITKNNTCYLTLTKIETGVLTLEAGDNGIGMDAAKETMEQSSIGLTLIETLSAQIHGKLTTVTDNGVKYTISFTPRGGSLWE